MRGPILFAVLMAASPALAGDHRVPPVTHQETVRECGGCHMAFQPVFLPARSWAHMMDGLADHFGEDVTLPPTTADAIRTWLMGNAGGRKYLRGIGPDSAPLRITETPAFLREHDFRPERWNRPGVLVRSNCPACHQGAERGLYDDDDDD